MKLTANELLKMKIIDEIIKEPIGGAHRNKESVMFSTKQVLVKYLDEFKNYTREEIIDKRKDKFLEIGKQKTFTIFPTHVKWIAKDNFFAIAKGILFRFRKELIIISLLVLAGILFII